MDSGFGARLRAQREDRHVALATIAEQTKIKQSLLDELERDDVSHWPPGIFRRSYIRAYAQAIGLDPDSIVREFLTRHPDPSDIAPAEVTTPADGESSRWAPTRLRFLIGSAMAALPTRKMHVGHTAQSAHAPVDAHVAAPVVDVPLHMPPAPAPAPAIVEDVEVAQERLPFPVDLSTLAGLCTRLAGAAEAREVTAVLAEAATLFDAVGLVLWWWDRQDRTLRPVFSHGYPDEVVAQLAGVSSDSENALAASFRSADIRVVDGNVFETGAIVVPLTTPSGCAGVLALELRGGWERRDDVRAFATILAAQLSTLVEVPSLAHAASA